MAPTQEEFAEEISISATTESFEGLREGYSSDGAFFRQSKKNSVRRATIHTFDRRVGLHEERGPPEVQLQTRRMSLVNPTVIASGRDEQPVVKKTVAGSSREGDSTLAVRASARRNERVDPVNDEDTGSVGGSDDDEDEGDGQAEDESIDEHEFRENIIKEFEEAHRRIKEGKRGDNAYSKWMSTWKPLAEYGLVGDSTYIEEDEEWKTMSEEWKRNAACS